MSETVFFILVVLFMINVFLWNQREDVIEKENVAVDLANRGHREYQSGNASVALALFEQSSSLGQPNALASLLWLKLILNDFEGAIQSHQNYISIVQQEIDARDQRHNIATNLALAHWLNGTDAETVKTMCATAARAGNPEAVFLTYIIKADSAKKPKLTVDEIQKLLKIFKSIQNQFLIIQQIDPSSIKLNTNSSFVEYARDGEKIVNQLT